MGHTLLLLPRLMMPVSSCFPILVGHPVCRIYESSVQHQNQARLLRSLEDAQTIAGASNVITASENDNHSHARAAKDSTDSCGYYHIARLPPLPDTGRDRIGPRWVPYEAKLGKRSCQALLIGDAYGMPDVDVRIMSALALREPSCRKARCKNVASVICARASKVSLRTLDVSGFSHEYFSYTPPTYKELLVST